MLAAQPAGQSPSNETDGKLKEPAEIKARLAFRIKLGTILSLGSVVCWFTYLAFRLRETQLWNLAIISWLVLALGGLSITKTFKSRSFRLFFIQFIFSLTFILTSIFVQNSGVYSSVIILVFSIFLAAIVFSGSQIGTSICLGIVLAMAASLGDVFSPLKQVQAPVIIYSLIAYLVVMASVFIFLAARKIIVLSIRIKLIAASLIIALIPIVVISYFQAGIMAKSLENSTGESLELAASQAARNFDQFLLSNRLAMNQVVKLSAFADYLSLPPALRPVSMSENKLKVAFETLQNRQQAYLLSYGLLDSTGANVFDTSPGSVGQLETSSAYFQVPLSKGQIYVSGIEFIPQDRAPIIYISGPIFDSNRNVIGVLRAVYDAKELQKIALENISLAGNPSFPILVDENNWRLADALASEFSLSPDHSIFKPTLAVIRATSTLKEKPWTVVYVQEQAVLARLLKQQNQLTILIATLIAGLISFAVTFFSRFLTQPIVNLTKNAEKISGGDFNVTVPVTTRDEIGTLAYAFNLMTDRVRLSINSLEDRVRSRTSELETQNRALRNRTQQIQTVAEVARTIASSQDLEILLPQITSTISERCSFYHVGIFLIDEAKEFAVLRAANSEGGMKMLARGHKLPVGKAGIVGYVTATGKPRIAFDVGEDAAYFKNPDLSQTQSEMALPLITKGEIIGALDVQSEVRDAFSQEDIDLFSTLADQVAIAIVNSRLYQETRRSLEESQQLHRQYLRQEWSKLASETPIIGYQYSSAKITPLFTGVLDDEKETHLQADSTATVILEENGRRMTVLKIPITLRGEVIGTIDLKDEQGVSWDAEAVATARAVADQVSQALENARLFEQTQRRADRERKVLEITSRIRSTNDPETMLQIAATELQNALAARANIVSLRLTEQTKPEKIDGNGHQDDRNGAEGK